METNSRFLKTAVGGDTHERSDLVDVHIFSIGFFNIKVQ
jgi:hypothetical protein